MHTHTINAVVAHESFDGKIQFADEQALMVLVHGAPHGHYHLQHFRPVGGVDREQRVVWPLSWMVVGIRRVIAKLVVFDKLPQGIHPEAVHPSVEPKAQDVQHGS
jgi:hypothetical protein